MKAYKQAKQKCSEIKVIDFPNDLYGAYKGLETPDKSILFGQSLIEDKTTKEIKEELEKAKEEPKVLEEELDKREIKHKKSTEFIKISYIKKYNGELNELDKAIKELILNKEEVLKELQKMCNHNQNLEVMLRYDRYPDCMDMFYPVFFVTCLDCKRVTKIGENEFKELQKSGGNITYIDFKNNVEAYDK